MLAAKRHGSMVIPSHLEAETEESVVIPSHLETQIEGATETEGSVVCDA